MSKTKSNIDLDELVQNGLERLAELESGVPNYKRQMAEAPDSYDERASKLFIKKGRRFT